jgi:hypothetical protein
VHEYAPLEVKMAIAGDGSAGKQQVLPGAGTLAEVREALTAMDLSPQEVHEAMVRLSGEVVRVRPASRSWSQGCWTPRHPLATTNSFLDAEGVGSNLAALAAYAVTPRLGRD